MPSPLTSRGPLSASSMVPMVEVAPDLVAEMGEEDAQLARHLVLPARRLPAGRLHLASMLERNRCFGMLVWRGLIVHRTSVGDRSTTRVVGSGDIVTAGDSYLRSHHADEYVVTGEPAHVALLGPEVLQGAERLPTLLRVLQLRMGEQHHRLVIQMAICQLPRVEDRVLAILWLLAESWGRVSAEGTLVPIDLTHQALGELIGAKRPTVTLAVSELARRHAAERRAVGWLLHDAPPEGILDTGGRCGARLIGADSPWDAPPPANVTGDRWSITSPVLASTIDTLRVDHEMSRSRTEQHLMRARELRRRSLRLRGDIARERASVS